jgi:hypothetical protein
MKVVSIPEFDLPDVNRQAAVTATVAQLIQAFPNGILCYRSQNSLHRIIGEMPVTLDFAMGELIAVIPGIGVRSETIEHLSEVAWHFTDEDGHTHVTVIGQPVLVHGGAEGQLSRVSSHHHEMLLQAPLRLYSSTALVTKVTSIRYEVPNANVDESIAFNPKTRPCRA